MSPLLFALVELKWWNWHNRLQWRLKHRPNAPRETRFIIYKTRMLIGWWRSLWGVL